MIISQNIDFIEYNPLMSINVYQYLPFINFRMKGYYSAAGATSPIACAAGTYMSSTGASACSSVTAGKF